MCSPAALQLDVQRGKWLHADHVVHDSRCIRVVCAIVEFVNGACRILKALIPVKTGERKCNSSLSKRVKSLSKKSFLDFPAFTFL